MADWSLKEVELIIEDYFSMFIAEEEGRKYSKAEHRNQLGSLLQGRSDGSIEFKHQNISAVLADMGLPYIKGYKPRYNFQDLLAQQLMIYIDNNREVIEHKVKLFADRGVQTTTAFDFTNMSEAPPARNAHLERTRKVRVRSPFKINYLEREQQNARIGKVGEELAVEYERWRLNSDGLYGLAEKVEWIGEYDDGAGFDILSFNFNGSDRYIEVKSTKLTKESPIFFSTNEYEFSRKNADDYYLYRFFNIDKQAKFFTLQGDFDSVCRKEVVQYKGYF